MATHDKEKSVREWIKLFIPIIVLLGGWGLSHVIIEEVDEDIQKREFEMQMVEQERSNDIAIAQMALNVLIGDNDDLHSWLPQLVGTIRDSTLKQVISDGVQLSKTVRKNIKDSVEVQLNLVPPAESELYLNRRAAELDIEQHQVISIPLPVQDS